MASLLLAIIYAAFISLGLPDSLLGASWPSMYTDLNVPMAYAGWIAIIVSGGTIVSSLMSEKVIRKFGTGIVTTASVATTAVALFGFSFSHSFWVLCLWGIPYGLGAGSVDAALNNFVALHYRSRHMNWLHCFWGVGASLGPYIMGLCLTGGLPWNNGYQTIGFIQVALVACLFISLPLWKREQTPAGAQPKQGETMGIRAAFRLPGAGQTLAAFFCYCGLETTTGLWASSYMVLNRGIAMETAATMASLFYLGITGGRFLAGFAAIRLDDRRMVRLGLLITALGIGLIFLPLGNAPLFAGLALIGLGCAPIYPGLLHETPVNFGPERSQLLMGIQMACAYTGSTLMPPLFGLLAQNVTMALYPAYLLVFLALMAVMTERANRIFRARTAVAEA